MQREHAQQFTDARLHLGKPSLRGLQGEFATQFRIRKLRRTPRPADGTGERSGPTINAFGQPKARHKFARIRPIERHINSCIAEHRRAALGAPPPLRLDAAVGVGELDLLNPPLILSGLGTHFEFAEFAPVTDKRFSD